MNTKTPSPCQRLLALCLVLLGAGAATSAPPPPIMPLSQVKPGMSGYGLTVWEGNQVDRFDVSIIGVLPNVEPRQSLILARISGGVIKRAGVVAGMSGSPVYIDGKVVGALSQAWPFQREALAGITPIENMIALLSLPRPKPADSGGASGRAPDARGSSSGAAGLPQGLSPIRTPIFFGGVPKSTLTKLQSRYEGLGFVPLQGAGGGGSTTSPKSDELVPGAAVGVPLVSGDMSVEAVGTLTYRDGDRFVAFGHAFMGLGECGLPLAPARVHTVMPSLFVSFKIASCGAPAAELEYDRPPGIAGRIGPTGRRAAFSVAVTSTDARAPKSYGFSVCRVGMLTEIVLMTLVDGVLGAEGRNVGEQSFATRLTVELKGRGPLVYENLFSTHGDHIGAVLDMLSPLLPLLDNRFERVDLSSARLEVDIHDKAREARIESVRIDRLELERGEEAEVAVVLKPFSGPRESVRLRFKVPNDAAIGPAQLFVSDAMSARARAQQRNPGRYTPSSLENQIALGLAERRNNEVILQLLLARDGVNLDGTDLPRLPGSALSVIACTGLSGYKKLQSEVEARSATRFVIQGGEMIEIRIKEHKEP